MTRIISSLQNVLMRVIITLSLVIIAFFISAAFDYGNAFQAQAKSLTPEATEYEVNSPDSPSSTAFESQDRPLTPEATKYEVNSYDSPFRENDQEKVNQLFKENKRPQTASETTREIGENLSKPQKTIKRSIEKVADNVKENLNIDQE
jgi:preprotein translocase subunit SecF